MVKKVGQEDDGRQGRRERREVCAPGKRKQKPERRASRYGSGSDLGSKDVNSAKDRGSATSRRLLNLHTVHYLWAPTSRAKREPPGRVFREKAAFKRRLIWEFGENQRSN